MTRESCMILVTGAAGLNGSAIVREFSRNGVPVRALVRDRSKAKALAGLSHVELVEGDMARAETLSPALQGVGRVLMISSAGPQMVETQYRFVDACKAAGVAHVVKFSGKESGIGFDAKNFRFTRMHEDIERYLENMRLGLDTPAPEPIHAGLPTRDADHRRQRPFALAARRREALAGRRGGRRQDCLCPADPGGSRKPCIRHHRTAGFEHGRHCRLDQRSYR